jgi:hypothetical protein
MSHVQHENPYSSPNKIQFLQYPSLRLLNKYPFGHLQPNYHLQIVLPYVSGHI